MIPLDHSFSAIIAAPSRSGKTTWISRLINHKEALISPPPKKCYFCYTEWQPLYNELKSKGVEFHKGLIDIDKLDQTTPKLLILDDMLSDLSPEIGNIFTKHSHHRNMSVIFTTQNIFDKNKHMRTLNLNATYLVLFKNPRDNTQINYLSRQMRPDNPKVVQEAYDMATSVPYGYLLVDLNQHTPDELRLRSGIFPGDKHYVYIEKSKVSSFDTCSLDSAFRND